MDTIQIEITNACHSSCSNCTRFCGHSSKPFFMSFDYFKKALDTMADYPNMTGIMGGDPLLHPEFNKICEYAHNKIPAERLGLWTSFPAGYEHYREVICRTFGNIFLNDHTRDDIYHAPVLVGAEEAVSDEKQMWFIVDHCWLQHCWSAAINTRGAFFCEIAAALSVLYESLPEFENGEGWKIEDKWWLRTPKDYIKQMEKYCRICGCAIPLKRRVSTDGKDDVSRDNLERLKRVGSRKVRDGKYVISDLKITPQPEQMAAYKEQTFRDRIAARYGIFLVENKNKFLEPHLIKGGVRERKSLFEQYKEKYA
jgi:hypothetical protein